MEKQYYGKEIVEACSYCEKEGRPYFMRNGKIITDINEIWDIEDQIAADIAVLNHSICNDCLLAIYPDMCHDDNLTLLK